MRILHVNKLPRIVKNKRYLEKDLAVELRIKGRIIGTKGKTLKILTDLSDNFFELDDKNNRVGIIGNPENIQTSHTAIISLIKGSKTGNVYTYLEKHRPEKVIDLGLKKSKETKKAKSNL